MEQFYKAFVVAEYTFRDLLRSKILWNAVLVGAVLALISFVAAEFTFGVPARVATDLGLSSLALSGYGLSFFAAVSLIRAEEESRTVYLIISRPIARPVFLFGKVVGVVGFLALNYVLILSCILTTLMVLGAKLDAVAWAAVYLGFLELVLLMILIVVVSLVANRAITIIAGLVMLIGGHALGETRNLSFVKNSYWLEKIVTGFDYVFPGLHKLNLKDQVLYGVELPAGYVASTTAYALCYIAAALALGSYLIQRKDFD